MSHTVDPSYRELPSSRQLLKSTGLAAAVAGVVLVTVILPTEYGIDLTGFGALTGLVEIGERNTPLEEIPVRSDELTLTLKPGHAAEVKLRMKAGASATFAWTAEGGEVNVNSHGEGDNDALARYRLEKAVTSGEGRIDAQFYGHHGWYWRNVGETNATVIVRTEGNYGAFVVTD